MSIFVPFLSMHKVFESKYIEKYTPDGALGTKLGVSASEETEPEQRYKEAHCHYEDPEGGSWEYGVLMDDSCVVLHVLSDAEHLVIPEEIEGYPVVCIEEEACSQCENLRSVKLPANLQAVGYKAFAYQKNLESVEFSEGLTVIDDFAFMETSLKDLVFPSSLRSIGSKAFFRCRSLAEVSLNEGLQVIDEEAFYDTAITTIELPASVMLIGKRFVFNSHPDTPCRIVVSEDSEVYSTDEDGYGLYAEDDNGSTFLNYFGNAQAYEVRPGTVRIDDQAFQKCTSLQSIELPSSLKEIGNLAFRNCEGLTQLTLPEGLERIGANAIIGTNIERIDLPTGLEHLDDEALVLRHAAHTLTAQPQLKVTVSPDNRTFFPEGGMICQRLDDGSVKAVVYDGQQSIVRITDDITSVGDYLLYGARGIDKLYLHDGIPSFNLQAFNTWIPIPYVEVKLNQPFENRSVIILRFDQQTASRMFFMKAFNAEQIDVPTMVAACDIGIASIADPYNLGMMILDRLEDPFLLDHPERLRFEELILQKFEAMIRAFAVKRYMKGFDLLAEFGFLDEGNFDEVMQWVHDEGDISVVGYLLEMKKQRFATSVFDSYDI